MGLAERSEVHRYMTMRPVLFYQSAVAAMAFIASSYAQPAIVLPEKITLFADVALPVPAAVVPAVQPVKAGTEVFVKSIHGEKVKIAYGLGEGLVDVGNTDFVKRAEEAQVAAAQIQAAAQQSLATQPQGSRVVYVVPATSTSSRNDDDSLLGHLSNAQDKQNELIREDGRFQVNLVNQQMKQLDDYYQRGQREIQIEEKRLDAAKRMGEIGPIRYKQEMDRINDTKRDLEIARQQARERLQHDKNQLRGYTGGN